MRGTKEKMTTKEKYLLVLVFSLFIILILQEISVCTSDPEEWETPRRCKSLPMTGVE
jgi:hypothetical protein